MSLLQVNYSLIRWPNIRFANKSIVSDQRLILFYFGLLLCSASFVTCRSNYCKILEAFGVVDVFVFFSWMDKAHFDFDNENTDFGMHDEDNNYFSVSQYSKVVKNPKFFNQLAFVHFNMIDPSQKISTKYFFF